MQETHFSQSVVKLKKIFELRKKMEIKLNDQKLQIVDDVALRSALDHPFFLLLVGKNNNIFA